MSLGILLVTHGRIGSALLETASRILPTMPTAIRSVGIDMGEDPSRITERLLDAYEAVESNQGVLVLCDLIGATPCNSCCMLRDEKNIRVVTGVNLPLLLRALTHLEEPLDQAARLCESSGADAITTCYDGD